KKDVRVHSLKEKGKILEVLKIWPERSIQVIVVTDGERILGLRDLECQGVGISVGKSALYTALGGLRPSAFMAAVKQNYGEKVLVQVTNFKQFKDFVNHNAFKLLAKYGTSHLVFNDDIQAGTEIAELIALEMSKH
ncbi:hypothetical protein S83_016092, partial [Arachis hypogaea]